MRLQRLVQIERDPERGQPDHDAESDPQPVHVHGPEPLDPGAREDRDQEQRPAGADRVGQGNAEAAEAGQACGLSDDRREDEPGAGREDEPERGSEQEAAAEVAAATPAEARERAFDRAAELRDDQRRRGQEQQPDRDVAQQVLRQAELVDDPGQREQRDEEGRDEAGDDREGPPRAAARASGEHDREHRVGAGRDRGDDPGEEGNPVDQHSLAA